MNNQEATMNKILEAAKKAGADIGTWDKSGNGQNLVSFSYENLTKFVELLQSQSEPVGEVRCRNGETFGFIGRRVFRDMLPLGTKLFTAPPQQNSEPVVLNNMSNSPEHVANYIKQSMPNNSGRFVALLTSPNINECVNRFLGWKLPSDFSPDCGISFEQYSNPDNDRYKALREPTGTNLFNAEQAKAMFQHVLKGATTELAEQPPATQELLSYISRLEVVAKDILNNYEGGEKMDSMIRTVLQSKPAKG